MAESAPQNLLIAVGLGNPGDKYKNTRHNLGFRVIDTARDKTSSSQPEKLKYSLTSTVTIPNGQLVLVCPTTYMNLSGKAVIEVCERYQALPRQLLVIVDDIYLPLGAVRIRPTGSDGGHNGLTSIIESIDTQELARIRLGVGPVPEGEDAADFVLARFSKSEREIVEKIVLRAAEAVIFALDHPLAEVMSKFNCNPAVAGP